MDTVSLRRLGMTATVALAATGCFGAAATNATSRSPAHRPSPLTDATASKFRSSARPATTVPTRLTAPAPGWTPLAHDGNGVIMDRRSFRVVPDVTVVVMRFRAGQASFSLHAGSVDPGWRAYRLGVAARSVVSVKERPHLIAAFTGGFYLSTGSGGYVQERHVVLAPRPGLASLVIDQGGLAHVGVWGRSLPVPGERVFSVRQNLPPLVVNGRPSIRAGALHNWGATLGGGAAVARCALGQDKAGDLLFAAAMSVTPAELATALVRAGARTAMELDINPEWVQFDYSHIPGGRLTAGIPGQHRPADQYLRGWTRDFIVATASPMTPTQG